MEKIHPARLDTEIVPAGLDWITALRAPAIRALAESGALQMSLFDGASPRWGDVGSVGPGLPGDYDRA